MDTQQVLEGKHGLLKDELIKNLQKRQALELQISQQFEELKRLEISLERACADRAESR
jgi:hypothetical protein